MVSLKDIAEHVGINIGSVSHVLNNHPKAQKLRSETRKKILQAADEMGYVRNRLALSVLTGKSRTLAFVTANMGNHNYTGRILEGILDRVSANGYSIKLYHLNGNDADILKSLCEWQVAGVIFHVAEYQRIAAIHLELDKLNIPVALVNLNNHGQTGFGITTDDEAGAYAAVSHLIDRNCRKISCVKMEFSHEYSRNRANGYLRAMQENKLKPDWINVSDEGSTVLNKLLAGGEHPEALFCVGDVQAMSAMRAAYRHGIRVPDQLKIAGFGDLEIANQSVITLTSVHQEYETMGNEAAAAVIRAVENSKDPIRGSVINRVLPTQLIIRESSTKTSQ